MPLPLTATIETSVDVPVAPGVDLYDVPCEVEVAATDEAACGFHVVAIGLDAFADVGTARPGRRWSYVEIARWHPGHANPFTPTKLSWHLAKAIAKKLERDDRFAARARDALGMARADERASGEKWKAARDDRAAAE